MPTQKQTVDDLEGYRLQMDEDSNGHSSRASQAMANSREDRDSDLDTMADGGDSDNCTPCHNMMTWARALELASTRTVRHDTAESIDSGSSDAESSDVSRDAESSDAVSSDAESSEVSSDADR